LVNGSNSSLIPSSIPDTEEPKSNNNSNFLRFNQRKSSQGLSAGGIVAIIVPIVAALIAVGILSMMCSRKNVVPNHALDTNNSVFGLSS